MTNLEQIQNLLKWQTLFVRNQDIEDLVKDEMQNYNKYQKEIETLQKSATSVEENLEKTTKRVEEQEKKEVVAKDRIKTLDESKDKIKVGRQIRSWEREYQRIEQDLGFIQAQITYDKARLVELEKEKERLANKVADFNEKLQELETTINSVKDEHLEETTEIREQINQLRALLDPVISEYFEHILEHTKGQGIVTSENGTCSGCHIILPTAIQGEMGEEVPTEEIGLYQCPNCFKYLYDTEWISREIPTYIEK